MVNQLIGSQRTIICGNHYKDGKKWANNYLFRRWIPKVKGNFTNDLENGRFTVWNEYDGSHRICL